MRHPILLFALLFAFTLGCDRNDDDDTADDDTGVPDDDSAADDDDTPDEMCPETDLPPRDFVDAEEGTDLYDTAADFTVSTRAGDWTLSENWTGCDTYLFIPDDPNQAQGWPTPLWDRDVDTLLDRLPRNVHVFFSSDSWNGDSREEALDGIEAMVEDALGEMDDDDAEHWRSRIHYVTDASDQIEGYLGSLLGSPGWGLGIDGQQRIRYIGSFADHERYSAAQGWFEPNLSMAANEPVLYNFESQREVRLAAQDATVIPLFNGEVIEDPGWAGVRGSVDVTLPDAETMETFDTMELDLYLGCVGDGEFGTCPDWDYLVHLYLCDEDDPDTCDTEFGRWITTYHREGRWVHDVTPLLPLLANGGERRFEFYTQQEYEVDLDLRLSNSGREMRPTDIEYLFSGGEFNATYNFGYSGQQVILSIYSDRIEIAALITGHGGVGLANCAEFCPTEHHFIVEDDLYVVEFDDPDNVQGCMDQVVDGTIPNQYGTWWYGRNGWCPGKEVQMVTIDVSDSIGYSQGIAVVEYEAYTNGQPFVLDGASILMSCWLIEYREYP